MKHILFAIALPVLVAAQLGAGCAEDGHLNPRPEPELDAASEGATEAATGGAAGSGGTGGAGGSAGLITDAGEEQ